MQRNVGKQFKAACSEEQSFGRKFDDQLNLHKKDFLMLWLAYEVLPMSVTRMFRMTLAKTALTLFLLPLQVNQDIWESSHTLLGSRNDLTTKQGEMPDEWTSLKWTDFHTEGMNKTAAFTESLNHIAVLMIFALPSDG